MAYAVHRLPPLFRKYAYHALRRRHHHVELTSQQQALLRPAEGGRLTDDDLVFSRPDGRYLLPLSVSQAWRRTIRKLGLSPRFHDLRHTHASLMLKGGVHPKIVSERLGHSSISITLDVYSHTVPGLGQAAALRFDEVLGSKRVAKPQSATSGI